jgi:hypothetical protein
LKSTALSLPLTSPPRRSTRIYGEFLPSTGRNSPLDAGASFGVSSRPIAGITPLISRSTWSPTKCSGHRRRMPMVSSPRRKRRFARCFSPNVCSRPDGPMAASTSFRSPTKMLAFSSPMTASSSIVSPAASCRLGHQTPRRKKSRPRTRRHKAVIVHSDADLATPPTAASPEASPTPDRPAFPSNASWSSTRVTENSPTSSLKAYRHSKTGDPLGRIHRCWPRSSARATPSALSAGSEAVRAGARLSAEAATASKLCRQPTVLTGTKPDMKVTARKSSALWSPSRPYEFRPGPAPG